MSSIKAILVGSVFVLVMMICLQLAFVFIAVGYNSLANDFPFLDDIASWFRYLVGIPVLLTTLFAGGYITASLADSSSYIRLCLLCSLVAVLTIGGMTYSAAEYSNLTVTGVVVIVLAMVGSSLGGSYWLFKSKVVGANSLP